MHETVTKLADESKALWMAADSLNSFTSWPDDLAVGNSAPNAAQAAEKIVAWQIPENSPTSPVYLAVRQATFHVNWQFI